MSKVDKTLRHWGYGKNFPQTTTSSTGDALTMENLETAIKEAKKTGSKEWCKKHRTLLKFKPTEELNE